MTKKAVASVATSGEMFAPLRAVLCTRDGEDKVFSIYFNNKPRQRAARQISTVKGKIKLLLQAQEPTDKKAKNQSLSCFIYDDDPDWNRMLDYCIQENLVDEEKAEAAKLED